MDIHTEPAVVSGTTAPQTILYLELNLNHKRKKKLPKKKNFSNCHLLDISQSIV